jgi:heptosyltransferase-1
MSQILFIKTSSLGDVVHHMPALTDARRHYPDATFTWLVEETFAPLVQLHPAVNDVIPVAWRRWRKSLYATATLREIADSLWSIRGRRYHDIIDSQGLMRSALMARLAHGRRHGYDKVSIREPAASAFYDARHRVDRALHAVERNRMLSGLALGYTPQGAPDFGLDRARLRLEHARLGLEREQFKMPERRYGVFLHATTRPEKEWAEENWIAVGRALARADVDIVLPWGTEIERSRSERIASSLPRARVPERAPLDEVAALIAGAQFIVGVDTGLLHLAAALSVPLVAIFVGSNPHLTGPIGNGPMAVLGAQGRPPSVQEVREAAAQDFMR